MTGDLIVAGKLQAIPLKLGSGENLPLQVAKLTTLLRRTAAHANLFTDYVRGCDGRCNGVCQSLEPSCAVALATVKKAFEDPDSLLWEVWDTETLDLLGILRLSDIIPGCDAKAHYCFFDGRLRDKTDLLKAWKDWAFADGDDWVALHRVTIEIPDDAFILAKHANRKLGFGGPFMYRRGRARVSVEGIRRGALLRDGEYRDMLILGVVRDAS